MGQVLEAIEEQEEAARLYALAPAPAAVACAPAPALAPAPAPAPASLLEDSTVFSETEGDTKTVEAPPPFDPSRDGSLGVERCRAALVEILGRNVTEESIASKMEEDERDASQINFGDFRWLLAECENDFDAADEAEEEAKKQGPSRPSSGDRNTKMRSRSGRRSGAPRPAACCPWARSGRPRTARSSWRRCRPTRGGRRPGKTCARRPRTRRPSRN